MKVAKARQLKDLSGWHWVDTHSPDCRTRGCDPHESEEAAQICQYEAMIASSREQTYTSARKCRECSQHGKKTYTDTALVLGGYMGEIIFLCNEHRTRDVLRRHTEPAAEIFQS